MIPPVSNRHTVTDSRDSTGNPLGRRDTGYDGDELVTREDVQRLYYVPATAWFHLYGNPVASIYPTREPLYSMTDLDTAMLGRAPGASRYIRVLGAPPGASGYVPAPDAHPEAHRYRSPYLPRDPGGCPEPAEAIEPAMTFPGGDLVNAMRAADLVNDDRRARANYREPFDTVKSATIRKWAARGHLDVAAVSVHGRRANLYRADDVLRAAAVAEANTRRTVDQGQNLPHAALDALLSTAEAAALADVAPSTVRMWAKRGKLTPAVPGPRPIYRAADVLALVRQSRHR